MPNSNQITSSAEPGSPQVPSSDNTAPIPSSSPAPSASDLTQQTSNPAPQPRLTALQARQASLEAQLSELQDQRSLLVPQIKLPSGLPMPADWSEDEKTKFALASANAVVTAHITALQRYNEIKDIGQGLMGMIAEARGVRVADVMEDFGVGETD